MVSWSSSSKQGTGEALSSEFDYRLNPYCVRYVWNVFVCVAHHEPFVCLLISIPSLLQLYPAQVSFSSFDALVSALIQAQEWDVLSTLLLAVRKVLHESNSNVLQKVREGAAVAEDAKQGPFLLDLPPTELRQKVVHLVHLLMGMMEL